MKLRRVHPTASSSSPAPKDDRGVILYVEDDDTNWDIARRALQNHYRLVRARNGLEVFSLLSWNKFDLILMDIELVGSEVNGVQITQLLRGRQISCAIPSYAHHVAALDTPIVFVSAYHARYQREELLSEGGDEFVIKPVDFTKLSLVMSRLMLRNLRK